MVDLEICKANVSGDNKRADDKSEQPDGGERGGDELHVRHFANPRAIALARS